MQISLMVEGQNGLTWERWRHILQLAERLKFPGVFRSDHFFIGGQQDSLEAYLSFVMAATETQTIRFGPLVTPVTFRTPVDVGRMAAQLDVLSEGRFMLGFGAGWNEPEHTAYGIDFPAVKERFDRMDDALRMMKALWSESPATYEGAYYRLQEADCLPRPPRGRPRLLIGGGGEKRTLRSVAEFADEWNCTVLTPEMVAHKNEVLARHCETFDRDPATIRKSMMTFGIIGPQSLQDEAAAQLQRTWGQENVSREQFLEGFKARGAIVGGTDQVVERLGLLAEQGIAEVQFQHFFFDNDAIPEYLAGELAPQVADL